MNRSLEALAIFTICLGGILAAVRISSQDQAAGSRKLAERPASPAVPAAASSSAREPAPADENGALADCFEAGCGLDRNDGRVYSAFPPLVSPADFAKRVILSRRVPVYVLPDQAEQLQTMITGYDSVYDAAVYGHPVEMNLSYQEIAAEYAAAELAAAQEAEQPGDLASDSARSFNQEFAAWRSLCSQGARVRRWMKSQAARCEFVYLAPVRRALEMRWSQSSLSGLLDQSQFGAENSRPLLKNQQAASDWAERVTWDDYLAFAHQDLSPPEPAAPKTSRYFPRVARQQDQEWYKR